MIVKNGRLFLWTNDVTSRSFEVKVGEGTGTNDLVSINQSALAKPRTTGLVIEYATQETYDEWIEDNSTSWEEEITSITDYLEEAQRKIVIYIRIKTDTALEIGEIGLFAKAVTSPAKPEVMISRNLIHRQFISTTEAKIIKYTINI